jgi:hypothetical protein
VVCVWVNGGFDEPVVQLSKGKAPMQIVEFERKKSADADGSVVASKAAAADNKVTNMSS